MMKPFNKASDRDVRFRRGNVIVFVLLSMTILISFAAFAVDIGHLSVVKAEMQNAADAAALSSARGLAKSPGQARVAATNMADMNKAAGEAIHLLPGQDVEIGTWDDETASFNVLSATNEHVGDAVRVSILRTAERGNPIALYFGPLLGSVNSDLRQFAIAQMQVPKCGRFVGIDTVDVSGGYVDSYDSGLGTYDSQTPGAEGHVCSNQNIVVKAPIHGDASPGDGYNVSFQSGGSVSGDTDPHLPKTYPATNTGNAAAINDNDKIVPAYWNGDRLNIPSNRSVNFPGGVLYASDLTINGQLRITGPTTIYVENRMSIAGDGVVNVFQVPAELKIYLLDSSGGGSTIAGSSDLHAVIYGPDSLLTFAGGAGFYGAAIAKELKLTNAGGCHFDKALLPFNERLITTRLVQ